VCGSVIQCVAVCCSVLQCVAVCCCVLCCSVQLQIIARREGVDGWGALTGGGRGEERENERKCVCMCNGVCECVIESMLACVCVCGYVSAVARFESILICKYIFDLFVPHLAPSPPPSAPWDPLPYSMCTYVSLHIPKSLSVSLSLSLCWIIVSHRDTCTLAVRGVSHVG